MATSRSNTRTGGHDCDFVTPPPKSLECSICLLTVCQPMVVSCCGNQFCQQCIGRIQQHNHPCPLCNGRNFTAFLHKGVMREVNSLVVRCPQKELGCCWEGELGQLETHLNLGGSGCGYVLVECRFKCGNLHRRNELENCARRPKMTDNSLALKLEDLSTKLDAVVADNKVLKSENEMLRRDNAAMRATLDTVQSCIMPVPPFNFTINNVAHFVNTRYVWKSAPFYSHVGGYKLCAWVYLNGCAVGEGTHISLYIAIMRGEFDHQLPWPFLGKITVEARNCHNDNWCFIKQLDFNQAQDHQRERPDSVCISNGPWGHDRFLTHGTLKESYLVADMVRFRIRRIELY